MVVVGRAVFQAASDVHSGVGGLALELENLMARIHKVQGFMQRTVLTDPPYSMDPDVQNLIKSAMDDMDLLRQVHDGEVNLVGQKEGTKDFTVFVNQLIGMPS